MKVPILQPVAPPAYLVAFKKEQESRISVTSCSECNHPAVTSTGHCEMHDPEKCIH